MSAPLPENCQAILDRFDDAWKGPTPPRIEDFLPPADSADYASVLVELIHIDMERRRCRGEPVTVQEYSQRFPVEADKLAVLLGEAQAAVARAASAGKETDDPRSFPTLPAPPLPASLNLPSWLLGEYEVLEPLGEGGMGKVYKARHRRLNKLVALKLLPANPRHPQEAAARFQREMKAVGALDHPNVIEAYDAGEQTGIVYLAMKLIEGVDLERLVKQRHPLPVSEACELARQAALGLHYLHERGLVHRDVKPSNLMRTADGTVKVLDLGLARWCVEAEAGHGLTGMGQAMGTPDFLAPEQAENAANADARADLYGLGGTLFYLLTGGAPFADRKSLLAKLQAHRSEPALDVRKVRPEVPAELADLIGRLLAKKPEERPATAAEVAAALLPFTDASASPLPTTFPTDIRALESSKGRTGQPVESTPSTRSQPPAPDRGERTSLPVARLKRALSHRRWLSIATVLLLAGTGLVGMSKLFLPKLALWIERGEFRPAELPRPAPPPPERSVPLQVMSLTVTLTPAGEGKPVGVLGEDVFAASAGDTVTVAARLTRPAHAFLIAFRPDGKVDLCFPDREDEPPAKTDRPRYPMPPKAVEYGLNDGTGLEAFAVVVSREPLPSFKDWWTRQGECPWKKEAAPGGLIYRANGEDEIEVLDADGTRGKGARVKGKTAIAELAEWLRTRPGIETVQVMGFVVGAAENR